MLVKKKMVDEYEPFVVCRMKIFYSFSGLVTDHILTSESCIFIIAFNGYFRLSTGALSRLILSDDAVRLAVNEFRASKVMHIY